jgi:hypothetical protein
LWSSYFSGNDAPKETVLAKTLASGTALGAPADHPAARIDCSGSVLSAQAHSLHARVGIVAVERSGRIGCVLRQPDMARIHGDTDLAASTRAGHCFEFDLNAANGRDGHFTSMYFTISVATASLTPGGIVPAISSCKNLSLLVTFQGLETG